MKNEALEKLIEKYELKREVVTELIQKSKIEDKSEKELIARRLLCGIIDDLKACAGNIAGTESIENMINEYKKEELPHANVPYHYEAEIASGFNFFIEWIKRREQ